MGLKQKVSKLSKGIYTTVGRRFDEAGFEPSGGEAQKIVLARAIYKNAPFIILDEPTAAMDPRAEFELYKGFHFLARDKSAIYISHRLSACKFCDQIAVLNHGKMIEYGSHDTLIAQQGLYAELYQMQAHYYE